MARALWLRHVTAFGFLLAVLAVACSSSTPNPSLPPSGASSGTAAQPARDTPTLDNLIEGGGWDCLRGGSVGDGKVTIKATVPLQGLVNDYRFHLQTQGDFSIAATIESTTKDLAGLRFWNSFIPPQQPQLTEWYTTSPQLTVGLVNGQVSLAILDGTGTKPVFTQTTRGTPLSGPVSFVLRKAGQELILSVNGTEAARTPMLGPFGSGPLILGGAISPGSQLTIDKLSVSDVSQPQGVQIVKPIAAAGLSSSQLPSLRSLALARGPLIGSAVSARQLRWNQPYNDTVRRESSIVETDGLAWDLVHQDRDSYQFCNGDQEVAFARANGAQVLGRTLSWSENPDWLTKGNFSHDELINILHEHIQTVVGRYRSQVATWIVANEVFAYDRSASLRDTIWSRGIGPEYIDMAFRWAHDADPQAVLLLNETDAEGLNPKSDAVYQLAKGLLARGVPITGVGMQMHLGARQHANPTPTAQEVAANMKRLADLGLDVYITEMDVPVKEPATAEELAAQAQTYRDILGVCLAATNCKAFVTGDVYDGDSWLNERPKFAGLTAPLLFDESFRPKPAYQALIDLLKQR